MKKSIYAILSQIRIIEIQISKSSLQVTKQGQKRTSNKSKLKQTKTKKNSNYKSSKPIQSKAKVQFRNKSNI